MSETMWDEPDGGSRGRLFVEWWASCGKCWDAVPLATRDKPEEEARKMGWRFTRKHGWECPRCARERSARSETGGE